MGVSPHDPYKPINEPSGLHLTHGPISPVSRLGNYRVRSGKCRIREMAIMHIFRNIDDPFIPEWPG